MKEVKIYFIGGSNLVFSECDQECIENLENWLIDDTLKTFKINGVNEGRETIIRKDLVLFIDIK